MRSIEFSICSFTAMPTVVVMVVGLTINHMITNVIFVSVMVVMLVMMVAIEWCNANDLINITIVYSKQNRKNEEKKN